MDVDVPPAGDVEAVRFVDVPPAEVVRFVDVPPTEVVEVVRSA